MKLGTKVICVDDSIKPEQIEWQLKYCPNWVKKNTHYTVRSFTDNDGIVDGVLLEEVRNPIADNIFMGKPMEPHFATWRFVEVLEPDLLEVEEIEDFFTVCLN